MLFENLSDDTLLRAKHLYSTPDRPGKPGRAGLLGVSRTSLYRLGLPKPVRLLPGVVAWRVGDLREWMAAKSGK